MTFLDEVRSLISLGCEDIQLCSNAARVYMDLKNVQGINKIEKFYDTTLALIYFRCGEGCSDIYLPYSNCVDILFDQLERVRSKICRNGKDSLFVSLCDPSSTVVYFKLPETEL